MSRGRYDRAMIDLEKIREASGITLSKEGVFHHEGDPVVNPKIHDLFSRGIEVRDDGRTILRVGPQWCYVTPEDTAFFVCGCAIGPEHIRLRLNDFSKENLVPLSLVLSEEGILYTRVKEGEHWARFSRNAFHQLSDHFLSDSSLRSGFRLNWGTESLEIGYGIREDMDGS